DAATGRDVRQRKIFLQRGLPPTGRAKEMHVLPRVSGRDHRGHPPGAEIEDHLAGIWERAGDGKRAPELDAVTTEVEQARELIRTQQPSPGARRSVLDVRAVEPAR